MAGVAASSASGAALRVWQPSRRDNLFFQACVPCLGVVIPLAPGWRFPGLGKEAAACASDEMPATPQGRDPDHAVPGLVLHVLRGCHAATEADIDPDRVKFLRTVRIIRRRAADPPFPP